ncbi:MAG: SusC/RagA family TonB-linked outer membrane protein, partial [Dysgonamonadaceae bacterium]|nr:SusC/RagA family TonB-linked outer membrane protein [Dysgonamonadaceae bacterium]
YDLLDAWEAMEFQAQGMVNLRDIRHSTASLSHIQFGSLDANNQLRMPYAIKPAGLSKEQIIEEFGSIAAWEASYRDDGTGSWSRSAYYQMLADGYSEEEARRGSNWYDLITRTGKVQNHQLSLSGGSNKGAYAMSIACTSREGTVIASRFDRYSLRANTTFVPNRWLAIGQNTNLAIIELAGERGIQSDESVFARTYTIQPWVPVKNIGGDWAGSQAPEGGRDISALNAATNRKDDWSRSFKGQSSVFAELKPAIEGFTLKTQYSATLDGAWDLTFNERTIMSNKEGTADNSLNEAADYLLNWQWTNTVTYIRKFNADHNMSVVIGSEALSQNNGRHITGSRIRYLFENNPDTWILDNGAPFGKDNSGYMHSRSTMFGIFGRADYSFRGIYLATLTIRRDASSRFAAKNRWGTFPSASLGWRISDEDFMTPARTWMNDLKLRAGYGTTGNSNIGAYNYAYRYSTGDNYLYPVTGDDMDVSAGYALHYLGDSDTKWETTRMLNTGFDATLLKNRLSLSADWYIKKTTDMLVPANYSALAGNAVKPQINIGDMENVGAEIGVAWQDKVDNLRYSVNANLSTYRNKVTKLGSSDLFFDTRLPKVNITTEGQPVGMFFGYKVTGIYQNEDDVLNFKNSKKQPVLPFAVADAKDLNPEAWVGRYKIEDVNGDGKINAEDRTIIGNPHPDFTGGMNIGAAYKNLDLSASFYFSAGNDLFMQYMHYTHFGALQSNYSRDRRDNSWHPVNNPFGIYPLWATSAGEGTEAANESNSTYVADGSYLRMQTLTIGYSLPERWMNAIGIEKIRLYGQLSNAFTWTRYPGLDPEVRSVNPEDTSQSFDRNKGVDYGSYGVPRQWILGVDISF